MADISNSNTQQAEADVDLSLLADITAVRAEVVKLVTDINALRGTVAALVTKLNADAGVTDADYAAPAAITAANPAALTTTA